MSGTGRSLEGRPWPLCALCLLLMSVLFSCFTKGLLFLLGEAGHVMMMHPVHCIEWTSPSVFCQPETCREGSVASVHEETTSISGRLLRDLTGIHPTPNTCKIKPWGSDPTVNNSEVINHAFESRSHNARGQAKSKWVIIWRSHTEIHLPNEAFRIISTTLSRSRCKSTIRAMAGCLPINVLVRGGLQRAFRL